MSTAVNYYEPYKLPAGILALLVHGVFFALLFFGFSWQTLPPATMSVELWHSLPDAPAAKPVQPKIEELAPPPKPAEIVEPDILIPDKKVPAKKIVESKKIESKPVVTNKKTAAGSGGTQTGLSDEQQQAARDQAEQFAAIGRVVDEYRGKIQSKIRRNVVMPPNVPNEARAEFLVTLLPGGTVLNARLTKPSGNAAYDNEVERAILKSQPLPLPADVTMFNRFRELKLVFKPTE